RLRISVADTGRGISARKLDGLFKPFNRLGAENSAIEGTGVGLSITRRLVELMGGGVGVDSIEDRGSTFWFELPLDAAAVVSADMTREDQRVRVAAASERGGRRGRLVLYVEDNPSNQMLMERVVAGIPKVKLMTASSAELGVEMARGERPDLILMDINLPGMDGYAALEELRADDRTRQIPVLALSANAMPGEVERSRAAGFLRYVTKPFVIKDMIEVLSGLLPAAGEGTDKTVVVLADHQTRRPAAG
ncbi:MAG: response regulator, partial [Alphaproteobacteria bacterium]|nr:response regulator [Alphaproteobacteria bacterium]